MNYHLKLNEHPLNQEVSKINSFISLLLSKHQGLSNHENFNEDSNIKLIELSKCFQLSVLKFIDDEYRTRNERKRQIIIIGLPFKGNDLYLINRLFDSLGLSRPVYFKRLKSNVSSTNECPPVICDLKDENQVKLMLKERYRLRNLCEFKKVYVNQHLTANERIINAISKNKKQKKTNFDLNLPKQSQNLSQPVKKIESEQAPISSTTNSGFDNAPAQTNQKKPSSSTSSIRFNSKNIYLYSSQTIDLSQDSSNSKNDQPIIVKAFGIELFQSDLSELTSRAKLNDKTLNFYMNLLCMSLGKEKFVTIDSLLIQKILSSDLRGIAKCLDKYNQSSYCLFLFPLLIDKNHWSLLVFNKCLKKVIYFDSVYDIKENYSTIKKVVLTLSKYISVLKDAENWELTQNYLAPKQTGDSDCGIYVCQYAKYFGQNQYFDFKQEDIIKKRCEMANEILSFEINLDDSYPNSFYKNDYYYKIRLDRSRHGGGLIVFIRNSLILTKTSFAGNLELISFQIRLNKQLYNFVYPYRAPNLNESIFFDQLEDFLHTLNLNEPLFIVGDLNSDYNNKKHLINQFIDHNDLVNFVSKPTRIATKYYRNSNTTKKSSTLIDILLHNGDLVDATDVIDCPFSDHHFLIAKLNFKKAPDELKKIECRNLSAENMLKINKQIDEIDYKLIREYKDVDSKWMFVKNEVTKILDIVSPNRKINLKNFNQFPWYDDDLLRLKHQKNSAYKRFIRTQSNDDKKIYEYFNNSFKKYNDEKLIEYFRDKSMSDFKNSKKFWQFYSTKINVKSDKSNSNPIGQIKFNGKVNDDKNEVCNIFNGFFTSIAPTSDCSLIDSSNFIDNEISENLIDESSKFKFSFTTASEINEIFLTIPVSSSPGISGIPTQIFKNSSKKFKTILAYLFNFSILTSSIPSEWKTAVVTPLFKKKGSNEDLNNYRGISILPPVAKLFEKLIHKQILQHLNKNNIISDDQHGFRANHSCES
ncbi:unnamed protein product [Brachionus calyciflorus]|uniref:Ubiquitin-like protease family profile domain-containing protein n=1 Tax=Brachionus calyciflorus TaxID=104777 RepID=A0A813VHK7_9BILA|nr:unnamed protein product [Brachionus calyciflorus]